MNPNGIVLIDKPAGISSFGVVARVRWLLTQAAGKKVKVGHTGTLDPFATGLMILVVGAYCKRAGEFSKLAKTYEATICLGKTSSTGDPEGELTAVSAKKPSLAAVHAVLEKFKGDIEQTPPAYSAIKIDGQRAYKLARAGKEVAMQSRQVTVHSLDVVSYDYPELKIITHVSSGTYVRTLAQDIGEHLKTGAYTTALRRTRIASFDIAQAKTLNDFTPADVKMPATPKE